MGLGHTHVHGCTKARPWPSALAFRLESQRTRLPPVKTDRQMFLKPEAVKRSVFLQLEAASIAMKTSDWTLWQSDL